MVWHPAMIPTNKPPHRQTSIRARGKAQKLSAQTFRVRQFRYFLRAQVSLEVSNLIHALINEHKNISTGADRASSGPCNLTPGLKMKEHKK
jgi:hypothetical protein